MSLELVRESIKVNQIIGSEAAQTVVDSDIIVPDIKPDIKHVLLLDGEASVNNTEVMKDKVLVNGVINFKILYLSEEEQSVKSINTASDFSYGLDVDKAKQGMKCKVRCDIEHIEHEILNERKINVKSIIKIEGKVINEIEQMTVNDVTGMDNVQVLRNSYNINCYLGSSQDYCNIDEALEVPAGKSSILEILRHDVKVSEKSFKVTENKIIVNGELNVVTLYIGDNESKNMQFIEHGIPFAQVIDFPGASENSSCEVDYKVTNASFEPVEDEDGEIRALKARMSIKLLVEAYEKRSMEVVEDAYSPDIGIEIEQDLFTLEEFIEENKYQISLKDVLEIDKDSPESRELFNVLCHASLSDYRIMDGKISLEGVVNNSILYLAENDEQPVFCISKEVPFEEVIDIPEIKADTLCEIELDVEHCNYSMLSCTDIEVRMVINVTTRIMKNVNIPLIQKVTEKELGENKTDERPSLIIYFTQKGDNLWNIAKKYNTTIEEMKKANQLEEKVIPGQQIIIPKRRA